jgi:hypothetical protein
MNPLRFHVALSKRCMSPVSYTRRGKTSLLRVEGFAVTVTVDAGTARVTVEFAARVPLVLAGDVGGIPITAEASATPPLS